MKKNILTVMILVFLTECKNTTESNLVTASIEKELVLPLKFESTTCKQGYYIWTEIQNKSKDSIFFYRPAEIFSEKKNGVFVEGNDFLNQIGNECSLSIKSKRMLNWFKTQIKHHNLTDKLLESILKDNYPNINKNLIGYFFFLAPNESIVYPFSVAKGLLYETKIIVKSDPKKLYGLGTGYNEKKFGKLPDKFMGYKHLQESFSSNTIQLSPNP